MLLQQPQSAVHRLQPMGGQPRSSAANETPPARIRSLPSTTRETLAFFSLLVSLSRIRSRRLPIAYNTCFETSLMGGEKNLRRRTRVGPSENLNTVWPRSIIFFFSFHVKMGSRKKHSVHIRAVHKFRKLAAQFMFIRNERDRQKRERL